MLKTSKKTAGSIDGIDLELKGMKRLPRGSFKAKPGATDPRNCKVKITTYIDADILEYFKKRADQPNAAPYQTQINNELRKVMEASDGASDVQLDMLNNKKFLKELKKKLETV